MRPYSSVFLLDRLRAHELALHHSFAALLLVSGTSLDLYGFKLTFDDEFNGFSSNGPSNPTVTGHTGTWDTTYAYGERKLNDEVEQYSDPTVGVDPFSATNGVLTITAAPSADPIATWGQSYTSGVITTNHSFSQKYGYFEMRAELPEGVGMWPAFWLLPKEHVWPPELDPLEAFGSGGTTGEGGAMSLHSGLVDATGGHGAWYGTGGLNLYTSFNTFGVDWEADTVTFYLDGKAYASMATPAGFDQPMYMLANLAVGGSWAGAPIGETASLKIDYIRAFSKDGANPAVVQQAISSPDGRGYDFHAATDANGNGALGGVDGPAPPLAHPPAPPAAPTGTQVVGSGPNVLALDMSEDPYEGDAQFVVTIDGTVTGGILSTSARHSSGSRQSFLFKGDYGVGQHTVGVNFINNAGGAPGADRNLYVDGATIDGVAVPRSVLAEYAGGLQSFTVSPLPGTDGGVTGASTPVIVGTGPDSLVLLVSEDAWSGDARFTASVDGVQVGGTLTATAVHGSGQEQAFTLLGHFGSGAHAVRVDFVNDAYEGPGQDRNLYVDGIVTGGSVSAPECQLYKNGPLTFQTAAADARTAAMIPLFDATYYLRQNQDVARAGIDPLQHFINFGWKEGRAPSPGFDTADYLSANPDVRAAGLNPLLHYALHGRAEGRAAFVVGSAPSDPLVDAAFVNTERPDVGAAGVDVSTWFHAFGWKEGTSPDALFDVAYYLQHNPDVAAAGADPLAHYERYGWHEGRDPSAQFSTLTYLARNLDVSGAGIDPLQHYMQYGQAEGRAIFPV